MTTPTITLALDKSVRTTDVDGRLHVSITNISKANVCGYRGNEIPDWQALGLDAQTVYQLYRDPKELEKAAPTFNNIQVLETHIPVSAANPKRNRVVGCTGSDAVFDAPYLKCSLAIWDEEAIAGIESGQLKELSCGYRYRAEMVAGVDHGLVFDGKMRDIVGNHVALVEAGRAGPDVVVGDSKLETLPMSKRAQVLKLALDGKLAKDATVDFNALLIALDAEEDDDDKNAKDKKARDEAEAEEKKAKDKKAKDEAEEAEKKKSDEEKAADKKAKDEAEEEEKKKGEDKKAMDTAIDAGVRSRLAHRDAIDDARRAVRPHVGELTQAFDSAEDVFKFALDAAGVDTKGVAPAAFGPMVKMLPTDRGTKVIAMDAKARDALAKDFPHARRLKIA